MSDLRLAWDPSNGRADLSLVDGDLDISEELATWTIVSLFSDRLAEPEDVKPPLDPDRRGWWGDSYLQDDNPGDLIGSRLWLLERAKSSRTLPPIAQGYELEALQWMLDDGLATALDAQNTFPNGDTSQLDAAVTISRDKTQAVAIRFDAAWAELRLAA